MEYWLWDGDLGKCFTQVKKANSVTHKTAQNRLVYIQNLGTYLTTDCFSLVLMAKR